MKKIVFPTQYGESAPKGTSELFTLPSLTEPDNSMSIPEIIARYTRGQGIVVPQHPWQQGAALEEGENELEPNEFDFMPGFKPAQQPAQQPVQQTDPQPVQQSDSQPAQQPAPQPAPPAPQPAPAGA